MAENETLTEKEILNKKFKKDIKGYDSQEVDQFLDLIIKDYITFQKDIAALNAEIASCKAQITKLEAKSSSNDVLTLKGRIHQLELENASYKNKVGGLELNDKVNVENIDYIKRINTLETFVWQLGFDPKTLKKRNG